MRIRGGMRHLFGVLAILGLAGMLSAPAGATTLRYKSFEDLVQEADGVVVGMVESVESHGAANGEIFTFVSLGELQLLAGHYEGSGLSLRLEGGTVGAEIQQVVGAPRFEAGQRVLLFVRGNGRLAVPIVGWTQGIFQVVEDPATGLSRVRDYAGNRVLGIEAGQVVSERRSPGEAHIAGVPATGVGVFQGGASAPLARRQHGPAHSGEGISLEGFTRQIEARLSLRRDRSREIVSVDFLP